MSFLRIVSSYCSFAVIASCVILSEYTYADSEQAAFGPRAFSERFYTTEAVQIPMRDGISLYTEIIRPRKTGQNYPFFMIRTPYGTSGKGFESFARMQELAKDGYIFILQEMRGTGRSGGDYILNPPLFSKGTSPAISNVVDEATDTFDTVEWLLANVKDHNGNVGVSGCSYDGYSSVMAALSGHPAIKAVSPQAPMADMFRGDDFYWNGIPIASQSPFFTPRMESRRTVIARFDQSDAYDWHLQAGALKDKQPAAFTEPSSLWQTVMENNTLTDFWKQRTLSQHAEDLHVPTLYVMGWFDGEDFPGPMRLFQSVDALDTEGVTRAIIGPWNHCMWNKAGPGNTLGPLQFNSKTADDFKGIEARFFAHYLKGTGTLDDMPQVQVYETGEGGGWRTYEKWPAMGEGASQKVFYLSDGEQLALSPDPASSRNSYTSDPMKPVPYTPRPIGFFTGEDLIPEDGKSRSLFLLEDQRFVHGRPDVLTWVSEPVEEDTLVNGQAVLEFYASTTGSDVDWIVQLIDAYPETLDPILSGYRRPVSRGALRGSLRNSLTEAEAVSPGEVEKYSVPLEARSHRFAKGHRIMVQLQSTYFPYLARNPQTFIRPEDATIAAYQKTTNTIHQGADTPSRILLPVYSGK